jgi:hypothetical protein
VVGSGYHPKNLKKLRRMSTLKSLRHLWWTRQLKVPFLHYLIWDTFGIPFFKVSCSWSLGISCLLLFFWLHAEIGPRWGNLQVFWLWYCFKGVQLALVNFGNFSCLILNFQVINIFSVCSVFFPMVAMIPKF